MERKAQKDSFIEPMPRREFLSLMKEFKKTGGKYIANDDSEAFLISQGVEATTLNENTILFRRRPSRSAVYEELFHVQQFRDGKISGSVRNAYECEVEAQEYLLKNADMLELTKTEIDQTEEALAWYKRRLETMKGEEEL